MAFYFILFGGGTSKFKFRKKYCEKITMKNLEGTTTTKAYYLTVLFFKP